MAVVTFGWPEDALVMLRTMIADRASSTVTAAAMSERFGHPISRSAVIAKALRLGLHFASVSPLNTARDVPKKHPMRKLAPSRIVDKAPMVARVPVASVFPPIVEPAAVAIPTTGRVTIDDLTDSTCRWPIAHDGDTHLFCGSAGAGLSEGRPYCAEHSLLAMRAPRPPRAGSSERKATALDAEDRQSRFSCREKERARRMTYRIDDRSQLQTLDTLHRVIAERRLASKSEAQYLLDNIRALRERVERSAAREAERERARQVAEFDEVMGGGE